MTSLPVILLLSAPFLAQATGKIDIEKFLEIHSDSGIKGPPYAEIINELKNLEKTYPAQARYFSYGTTPKGNVLAGIKIENKFANLTTKTKALYIGGSIHGNEYLNIEDRFPRWILEIGLSKAEIKKFLNQGGAIYIVPILNPDGYIARERENSNGEDLNRDYTVNAAGFAGFKEPETAQLAQFLNQDLKDSNRSLVYAIDYHCCIGALLYPWSFKTNLKLPPEVLKRYQVIGNLMQSTLGQGYKFGTTPDVLGYSARGTSKDFYHEHFGALGFTFEGERNIENKNFEKHTRFFIEVVKTVL